MRPIGTIGHPADFSEPSQYDFRQPCAIARDHGAWLIAIHVMPPPVIAYGGVPFPEGLGPYRERLWEQLSGLQCEGL